MNHSSVPITSAHHRSTTASRRALRFAAATMTAAMTVVAMLAGCGANLPPGTAGLRVTAVAEPKAGHRHVATDAGGIEGYGPPGGDRSPAESAAAARTDPYRLIDYRNLEDIVVCVSAADRSTPALDGTVPTVVSLDAGRPDDPGQPDNSGQQNVVVASIGDELTVANPSASAAAFYLRTDAGTVVDLGVAPPGGAARSRLTTPGGLHVFREAAGPGDDDRLATLFVTPAGSRAQRAAAGETVKFGPLPPGRYVVTTWHPRLPGTQTPVELTVGRYADVTVTVGVNGLPKVP